MDPQALAILNGAVTQLQALSTGQQAAIDADNVDIATVQTKLAQDQADVATQQAAKASTDTITTSLKQLIASLTPPA